MLGSIVMLVHTLYRDSTLIINAAVIQSRRTPTRNVLYKCIIMVLKFIMIRCWLQNTFVSV